jgi:hypothetical protein
MMLKEPDLSRSGNRGTGNRGTGNRGTGNRGTRKPGDKETGGQTEGNRGTDGTFPGFPKIDSYSVFYFNRRIRSCRNCRSGSCWVRASAFS